MALHFSLSIKSFQRIFASPHLFFTVPVNNNALMLSQESRREAAYIL